MKNLLEALKSIEDLKVIFTLPNSDASGRVIIRMIKHFVSRNKSMAIAFASLGQLKYLSLLQFVSAVVGNSSSGIIEVPSFGIPTLNIGNRQKGRVRADSVIDCEPLYSVIRNKLLMILSTKRKAKSHMVSNPYYMENTALKILGIIKKVRLEKLIIKVFYNL